MAKVDFRNSSEVSAKLQALAVGFGKQAQNASVSNGMPVAQIAPANEPKNV